MRMRANHVPGLLSAAGAGLLAAMLVLAAGAAPARAETPTPDPDLNQTVAPDEAIGDALAEVATGHVDVGPRLLDGEWTLMARDDTAVPPVWRLPADLVLRVNDAALLTFPDDPQFDFVDIPADQQVHVIPQTQNTSSVWLGWNTQDPSVVPLMPRGAELVLEDVEGPGDLYVFLSNGFDPPIQLWNSATLADDGEQSIWMDTNTHVHANWVFSEPGVYLATAEVRGESASGDVMSAVGVLMFAVGDSTTTAEVLAAADEHVNRASPPDQPTEGASDGPASSTPTMSASGAPTAQDPGRDEDAAGGGAVGAGNRTLWVGVGAGALIVVLGLGAWLVARRSAALRDAVEAEGEGR